MSLFNRKAVNGEYQVPVWFMRQAGRYHQHYQNIKKNSDFMTMCKDPKLACEVTMGPIEDFNFDAAILFSDLLFPLEQLGMGLVYNPGPQLGFELQSVEDVSRLKLVAPARQFYQFQADALKLLKKALPSDKTLLGFVGAPFTLYTYAVEGSHSGNLVSSKQGLYNGKFSRFMEILVPELLEEMSIQAEGGADAVCLFDTAAGELCPYDYARFIVPEIKNITASFKKRHPNTKIVYYSKHTNLDFLTRLEDKNIDVLGVDWRVDLPVIFDVLGKDYMIQGNIDPIWLHLNWNDLEKNLRQYWNHLKTNNIPFDRWIMGLGHGVTIQTPEENVRKTVQLVHELFRYG